MGDVSEHFNQAELACPHCGFYNATQPLIDALEELRSQGPEPIHIDDACRCPEHNLAVGGVPHSQHPNGEAADIKIEGLSLQEMYDRAKKVPAFDNGGIGVYQSGFIHVDVRAGKARWAKVAQHREYIGLEQSGLVAV